MKRLLFLIILFPLSIYLFTNDLIAQEKLTIDTKAKEDVVKKVASIMKEKYVFADTGEKMAKHIRQQFEKGEYKSFTEVKPFCAKLTSDLRDISDDKHLFVFYSPEEAREVAARNNLIPTEEISKINEYYELAEARENYGFKKVEILEGNIGYVDIEYISSSVKACSIVENVIGFLENTNAIIIDLRDNGGGGGSGADELLMSYFFEEKRVPFSGVYYRETDRIEESWSDPNVSGNKLPNIDLYILTSSKTFSAAEFIAYSLQALKRAVIIGETTKGGAHPIDVFIVKGDILTQISIGSSYNPITKTNWEGVGVKPDIEATSEDALNTAYIVAIENIINKTIDEEYKKELEELLKNLRK